MENCTQVSAQVRFALCDLSLSQANVAPGPGLLVIATTSTWGRADLEENFLSQTLKYKREDVSEGRTPIRTQPRATAKLKAWLICLISAWI